MMMKIKIVLIITLFFTLQLRAQEKNANKLLKKVVDKTASYKNFKAQLSYTMVNTEMNINEKKTGLLFVEGNRYRIEMEGQIIISDGKTIWTIINDSQEVMVSAADDSDESLSPTKILSTYSDYKAKFDKSQSFRKSSLKTIDLKPKKGEKFQKLTMVVNDKNYRLESFSIYDKDGNIFTYHIINMQTDLNLPSNTFVFSSKDYPDYEVEDMR